MWVQLLWINTKEEIKSVHKNIKSCKQQKQKTLNFH